MLPLRDLRVTTERSCAALGDALEEGDELRDDVVQHGHARERIHAAEPGHRDLREFSSAFATANPTLSVFFPAVGR